MLLHAAPPLIPGVPTADKLHVWTLTNYTQCVVLDADLMFLKPIDDVFGGTAELTIAHHPYDHLQAQCGVPVEARGIAAMIVMRPNLATYAALMRYLLRRFKAEQLLYSDQTGLMCFFGNRSRTLPCPYLYDVSMMTESFLPRWTRNCRTLCGSTCSKLYRYLRRMPQPRRQARLRGDAFVQRHCDWPTVAANAHAVHFKGNTKPWPSAIKAQCRLLHMACPLCMSQPSGRLRLSRRISSFGRKLGAARRSAIWRLHERPMAPARLLARRLPVANLVSQVLHAIHADGREVECAPSRLTSYAPRDLYGMCNCARLPEYACKGERSIDRLSSSASDRCTTSTSIRYNLVNSSPRDWGAQCDTHHKRTSSRRTRLMSRETSDKVRLVGLNQRHVALASTGGRHGQGDGRRRGRSTTAIDAVVSPRVDHRQRSYSR